MSSAASSAAPAAPYSSNNYLTTLGLGYAIAISLGFLVLFSTLVLASYLCCRASRHRRHHRHHHHHNPNPNPNPNSSDGGVILPRIIFVAEDDVEQQRIDDDENAVVGLDPAVINSYPKFPFSKDASDSSTCSICLCDYKDAEMLRMMPECRHSFHLLCLDAWLRLNGSCPVCRNSPLPTPIATPLQEVVPLSQYPADRRWRR